MVQVVEHRSMLSGLVQRVEPAGDAVVITLRVEGADPVPGIANLLQGTVGETITLTLPAGVEDAPPQPGDRIRCQARVAGPQRFFAIPGSVQAE